MSDVIGLEALQLYRRAIDAEVHRFFQDAPRRLGVELSRHGQQAFERLEAYCLRPGKRLRGSLAALTYDVAAGTEQAKQAIRLGVVLELMQAYLLIIDDVMDRSELRRGQPAMQMLYRHEAGDAQQADMIAINVGMLAQHLASQLLADIDTESENLGPAMHWLQRNLTVTGLGQLEDISVQFTPEVVEADIIRKYVQKSSYYTFVNPLQVGFALAGVSDESTLKACETFGVAAGVAFQLHDDYLGMFGTEANLGKSTLDDMREGKFTLLVQYALEHAQPADVPRLKTILGNQQAAAEELAVVQGILIECGARDYCARLAANYAETAKQQLAAATFGTPAYRQLLSELVEYTISRER